nr:contulakin M4 [Conus magus]
MQTAYWVMVMMMVWITAPLSEGDKFNGVIRGLVPHILTPQHILQSLTSRLRSDSSVRDGSTTMHLEDMSTIPMEMTTRKKMNGVRQPPQL